MRVCRLAALGSDRGADPVLRRWQLLSQASLCYGLAALACEGVADPVLGLWHCCAGLAVLWAGCACMRESR